MTKTSTSKLSAKQVGLKYGFRSGLEERLALQLQGLGVPFTFEEDKIKYTQPAKPRTYTPDFRLPNGIFIESKGRFLSEDRQKHLWIKQQHPELDIRFVFSNSKSRIAKGSKTTYAKWCEDNGFLYADKEIPLSWIEEDGLQS